MFICIHYATAEESFFDELKRKALMIMCDADTNANLEGFEDCVQDLFPDEMAAILAIRKSQSDHPDQCVTQMRTELHRFRMSRPMSGIQVMACMLEHLSITQILGCIADM
ncbi:unnamed protein product [Oppiella nova]|uniref:Uncharacterized protein n=1 Tax=Oppiella nova TaxID=334625 RepID=A0A7R9MNY7_9ACAR|nr:unnamed protein product [Oppiella nova]CAG2180024.1 unnamed protein product [Oppiella nova]